MNGTRLVTDMVILPLSGSGRCITCQDCELNRGGQPKKLDTLTLFGY